MLFLSSTLSLFWGGYTVLWYNFQPFLFFVSVLLSYLSYVQHTPGCNISEPMLSPARMKMYAWKISPPICLIPFPTHTLSHLWPPLSIIENTTSKMTSYSTTVVKEKKNTVYIREKLWFYGVWPLNSIQIFCLWLRMVYDYFTFFIIRSYM